MLITRAVVTLSLTQLLEDSRLPDLRSCRHFVNLTNGLDLAPILRQLELPFRLVGMCATIQP
jgi:hypothetical protein